MSIRTLSRVRFSISLLWVIDLSLLLQSYMMLVTDAWLSFLCSGHPTGPVSTVFTRFFSLSSRFPLSLRIFSLLMLYLLLLGEQSFLMSTAGVWWVHPCAVFFFFFLVLFQPLPRIMSQSFLGWFLSTLVRGFLLTSLVVCLYPAAFSHDQPTPLHHVVLSYPPSIFHWRDKGLI